MPPPNGSQGPFFLWEGQRGRWCRRWGFMLVNNDSTGFFQSPNTLAPLSSPLCPPFSRGYMVRAPQPELGYFQGEPSSLDRGFESPCLPLVSPGPAHPPAASFSPSGLFLKQPGVFPQAPCRWRERSWAQFGHACWHRRLKRCVCDCVTVWEPGLTDGPRATLWRLQVFCSSH